MAQKKKSEKPKRHIVWWLPVLTLVIGVFLGSGLTKGTDFFINKIGNRPVGSNAALPDNLNYDDVEKVYDSLRKNFDGELKYEDIINGLKRGLVESAGDPYTTYLTSQELSDFNGEINGTFTGIGAELVKENNLITVVTPLAGFPAEKAGVKARDIIIKIDDEDATSMSVADAVTKIRGEKGTTVKLTIYREDQQLEYSIIRDTISIPSVTSSVADGIGYMTIVRFGSDTGELAQKAAEDFKAQNVHGVVVDLRNNPGGYLDQAVKVASIWLPNGTTVVEEKRGGKTERVDKSSGTPILLSMPTRVLINGGSASASEILAGALKDNNAALLVGEKTFGKGSVQQVDNFSDNSALKVTVAKWFTPAGININKEGIKPDTEVKISDEDAKNGVDPQKTTAASQL